MRQAGATLHRSARASHCRGLSCCGAQAPGAQAQQLWLMDLVAPRHVGSSQTRARTRVPCIGRQTLNHCTTREAQKFLILMKFSLSIISFMDPVFGVIPKKSLPYPRSSRFSPMLSSMSFIVSCLHLGL